MRVTINGVERELPGPRTVGQLLDDLDLPVVRVAVEVNYELVNRGEYDSAPICDGDRIEIVTFVGGG